MACTRLCNGCRRGFNRRGAFGDRASRKVQPAPANRGEAAMPLLYEKRGPIAILTLSRPEARNALGEDYNKGLVELLPRLEDDSDIRAVILTGDDAGGAFSAGANIKDPRTHTSNSIGEFIESLPKRRRFQAMNLLSDFAKPLI